MGKFLRVLRIIVIVLVIVVGLAALGDRVANAVAERAVADRVADTAASYGAHSQQGPDVTIHGWPFATQAWNGEFGQIDIELREVGAEGLRFPELDLIAHDVDADWREFLDGNRQVTAATVDAEGTIALDSLSSLVDDFVDFDMTVADGGEVRIEATAEAAGQEISVSGSGQIALVDGALEIVTGAFELVEGALPPGGQELLEQYRSQLNTRLDLPDLPYGIELTEIEFTENTMRVTGSADDVVLA
ncbi:LmeA family phospholipid-binding protein [Glycomyces xiaoerkulensis]|uniref:LmeA family phospholipid-binding protein n=1 Tax=Glycomyces xiaoerkulensis TaxID=2038139 RepID=UPI0012FFEF08|nr:DUF2993 domain-containing protein [Glycomyces xiaoerkulensis]